jgi:hypothetical protein
MTSPTPLQISRLSHVPRASTQGRAQEQAVPAPARRDIYETSVPAVSPHDWRHGRR